MHLSDDTAMGWISETFSYAVTLDLPQAKLWMLATQPYEASTINKHMHLCMSIQNIVSNHLKLESAQMFFIQVASSGATDEYV